MFLSLPFPVSLSAGTETTARPSSRVLEIDRAALSHALTMDGCKRSLLSILIRHTLTSARLALAGVRYMQPGFPPSAFKSDISCFSPVSSCHPEAEEATRAVDDSCDRAATTRSRDDNWSHAVRQVVRHSVVTFYIVNGF